MANRGEGFCEELASKIVVAIVDIRLAQVAAVLAVRVRHPRVLGGDVVALVAAADAEAGVHLINDADGALQDDGV